MARSLMGTILDMLTNIGADTQLQTTIIDGQSGKQIREEHSPSYIVRAGDICPCAMTMLQKGNFIQDMVEKYQNVEGIFVTSDVNKGTDKNSNPYWSLTLNDVTGSVQAKIWAVNGVLSPENLESRVFVRVRGQVNFYRDTKQLRIDALQVLTDEEKAVLRLEDYVPPSPYNGEALMQELMQLVDQAVAGTPWERLVHAYFDEEANRQAFLNASAARAVHHVGRGGLVAHTLEVCRVCQALTELFPALDRPALLTAALFHDIGKVREMETDVFEVSYTTQGNLIGHIVLGVAMLEPYCQKAELPGPLKDHLFHLILSHHGRIDYGAVKEPATMEAVVLSSADYLDAKLNTMAGLFEQLQEGQFTPMQREFGRALFKPVTTASLAGEDGARGEGSPVSQPVAQGVQDSMPGQQPAQQFATRAAQPSCPADSGFGEAYRPQDGRLCRSQAPGTPGAQGTAMAPATGSHTVRHRETPPDGPDAQLPSEEAFWASESYLASLQEEAATLAPEDAAPAEPAPWLGTQEQVRPRRRTQPSAERSQGTRSAGKSQGRKEEGTVTQMHPGSLLGL